MHVIIFGAQGPVAIRNTIYGTDNVFILIKRAVFRGTTLNLFPDFLRKFSTGSCIVIRIYRTLFLAYIFTARKISPKTFFGKEISQR